MTRKQITDESILNGIGDLINHLHDILNKKGKGSFSSSHELLGVLLEEFEEFKTNVMKNSSDDEKCNELLDVAATAIFGYVCYKEKGMEW